MLTAPQRNLLRLSVLLLSLVSFAVLFNTTLQQTTTHEKKLRNYSLNQNDNLQDVQQQLLEQQEELHVTLLTTETLEQTKQQLKEELNKIENELPLEQQKIEEIYTAYETFTTKYERNSNVDSTALLKEELQKKWGGLLLEKKFDEIIREIEEANTSLDEEYQDYLASLPTPTPTIAPQPTAAPQPPPATGEYNYQVVSVNGRNVGVYFLKFSLNSITIKTVTANNNDCDNNCPAKSLADYINENNAYAGMHGTYFCPPDYDSCTNKSYSFDFATYDSNQGKWLESESLQWENIGLATFNGSTPRFYIMTRSYAGDPVTAGIANFPSLLSGGNNITNRFDMSSYQKDVRGTRGAIGVDNSHIYLAIVSSTTVPEAADALKQIGVRDALNLDGGGSSALYINGQYKVGPGRLLPNAVLIIK